MLVISKQPMVRVPALSAVGVALTCLLMLSVSHGGDASTVTVKRNLIVEVRRAACLKIVPGTCKVLPVSQNGMT